MTKMTQIYRPWPSSKSSPDSDPDPDPMGQGQDRPCKSTGPCFPWYVHVVVYTDGWGQ